MTRHALALTALVFAVGIAAADEGDKKAAELKWAKGVANDFLAAVFSGKLEQAEALTDPSLRAAFTKDGKEGLREWLNNSIAIQGYKDPNISGEEIAPDLDEAVFKGKFKSKDKIIPFTLRVAKGKDSGKWRVCFFQF